jgi:Thymidylate synthase
VFSYKADNVNQALQFGLEYLFHAGIEESSRNGPVLVAPGPVCVEYTNPRNRVLYSPTRDANPVFHLLESIWMLSGDWVLEFPTYFSSNYGQYSDDGKTMWDAYGHRWRQFFGWDQLEVIAKELRDNPTSRRCVLTMWNGFAQSDFHHPKQDEGWVEDFFVATHGGKAVPCNTHAYFAIRDGRLNMTVMNRSNDAIWGAFGANAVHFSLLLEYMAMLVGVPMGSYYQFTNNLHCYTDKFDRKKLEAIADDCAVDRDLNHGPLITEGFDKDVKKFMPWALQVIRAEVPVAGVASPRATEIASNIPDLQTPFMWGVIVPTFLFWVFRKWKDDYSSNIALNGIDAEDWRTAITEWADRRKK